MEESISRLTRQLTEAAPGSPERSAASAALVAGVRTIVENLLELAGSRDEDLRRAAMSALADVTMSIHQAGLAARHGQGAAGKTFPEQESQGATGRLFGEVAISRGLARMDDVLRALNIQKREVLSGRQPRLIGEILVAEKVLDQEQVRTVLMDIRGRLLRNIERQLAAPDEED
jgi:hypothetical protein